jgi:isopentenyl-diphosphate delta-isomerase
MVLEDLNQKRKLDHIKIVLNKEVEGPLTTWFEYLFLPHQALSEISPDDVDISVNFLGKKLDAPIIITGMTGGAPGTDKINEGLATVAEELKIAMGVGSQRAALENEKLAYTFKVARKAAPTIPLVANIGAAEFLKYDFSTIEKAVEMIEADALAIHLNLPQESVQPEGFPSFSGLIKKLERGIEVLNVPIMIKEVGFGLSYEVARKLNDVGIKLYDVAGAGGTNWVLVEMYRAKNAGNYIKMLMARQFQEWGIPTAAAIIEVRNAVPDAIIVGSGGIRTAVDAVKALRLGADLVGLARPALKAYTEGNLKDYLTSLIEGLKASLTMLGVRNLVELRKTPIIVSSLLREWIASRGLSILY